MGKDIDKEVLTRLINLFIIPQDKQEDNSQLNSFNPKQKERLRHLKQVFTYPYYPREVQDYSEQNNCLSHYRGDF